MRQAEAVRVKSMTARYAVRYDGFKKCSKVVAKRFAMPLSRAHEVLSRASGYSGLHELQEFQARGIGAQAFARSDTVLEVWSRRLRAELGADVDDLFPLEEQLIWSSRIHSCIREQHEDQSVADD